MGSSSSFRHFGTSSSAMHGLRKSLCDLYLTASSLSRFSFSANIYIYIYRYIYLIHKIFSNLQGINLDKSRNLLSNYFFKELLQNSNEILQHAIFSWYKIILTIINQLLQFYLLICIKIQLILKVSTSIVSSAVRAFTEKFRRRTNRFLQVALYFLLLILIVESYFALFN